MNDLFSGNEIKLNAASVVRRKLPARRCTRADNSSVAASAIGPLEQGDEVFILTAGDFSLIDVLQHVLDFTGPADVDCATWTQGVYDQHKCSQLREDGRIKSMRWLVDPSMFQRRADLSGKLIERFGVDSFRAVSIHAKYLAIRGERMSVAVRSSMNMNENDKIEQIDISVCPVMVDFLTRYTDAAFSAVTSGQQSNSRKVFSKILSEFREGAGKEGRSAPGDHRFATTFGF